MIADAPLAASARFDNLSQAVRAYIATAKVTAGGGVTWTEAGELLVGLLRLAVTLLDATTNLSGSEKKALAMQAVAALFDAIADRIIVPAVAVPLWMLCRPAVRSLVLALLAGGLEQVLPLVRMTR